MNYNQQLLVELLSSAIHNEEPPQIKNKDIDWNIIFNEAKAHEVLPLVYPEILKLQSNQLPNGELMSKWKKSTILSGIRQIQHIEELGNILTEFERIGIPVIALKGLVLRELYPNPELRSMSDADILVHKEEMASAREVLLKMGYYEEEVEIKHIHFGHKTKLPVELHQSLINHAYIKDTSSFEEGIWKNPLPVKVGNAQAMALSLDDQLLHLCLHMAVHIAASGFGLRQLCDLVILVESKNDIINWSIFNEKARKCGVDRFVQAIFLVCNQLFGMRIPNSYQYEVSEEEPYINLLIEDMFAGGVFGKSSIERVVANSLLRHTKNKTSNTPLDKFLKFIKYLFPSAQTLGERYSYAKSNTLLTPIAWVHRFIYAVIRKDFTSSQKKAFLFSSPSEPILAERLKLLKWLDLI